MFEESTATFDFNREEDGMVWVLVNLDFDIQLVLRSDDPNSPRSWMLEEITVSTSAGPGTTFLPPPWRSGVEIEYATDLGRALAREWDRYVVMEQRLPYGAGLR